MVVSLVGRLVVDWPTTLRSLLITGHLSHATEGEQDNESFSRPIDVLHA